VSFKGRGQMRIMNLNAVDIMLDEHPAPDRIYAVILCEECNRLLDQSQQVTGKVGREPEAVAIGWACSYIPKLAYGLRSETEFRAPSHEVCA
jgi:hypothetical protein